MKKQTNLISVAILCAIAVGCSTTNLVSNVKNLDAVAFQKVEAWKQAYIGKSSVLVTNSDYYTTLEIKREHVKRALEIFQAEQQNLVANWTAASTNGVKVSIPASFVAAYDNLTNVVAQNQP